MTMPVIGPTPSALLRAALQLYPARYRRERGEELAEVFADTTAEGGRVAVAREALGLAVYGLRVRLGLTGGSAAGRLLALLAPMVAGAVVGATMVPWVATLERTTRWLAWDDSFGNHVRAFAPPAAALLLGVAALLGRWTAVRVTALLLGAIGLYDLGDAALGRTLFDVWWVGYIGMATVPFVVAGLLLAAAPTDLLPRPNLRTAGLVVASAVLGGMLEAVQNWDDTTFPLDLQWFVVLLIAPTLLALAGLRGRLGAAAVGLAVLVVTGPGSLFNIWRESRGISHLLPVAVPVVALLVLVAVAERRFGRREAVGVVPGRA
ncbi:hypothetical protein ABTZ03_33095 [Kitasatospora sp. NPDC096077]|uniref:hypothetical protein n=1 Tax=Kitasatospora sp. NPDC096077 TaxID=3155544 RepID=UPI00331E6A84